MDTATRLKRHTQLWREGESQVRRIGIGGAIFSLLVVLTVIEPFYIKSAMTRDALNDKRAEQADVVAKQQDIDRLKNQLSEMTSVIEAQPWMGQISDLKQQFRSNEITDPTRQSNEALKSIADNLKEIIVRPLSQASAGLGETDELASFDEEIESEIDAWYRRHAPTRWWRTTMAKDQTASEIGNEINWILAGASDVADETREELAVRAADMNKQLDALDADIESLSDELTDVMNRALPAWARNIIDVEDLLVLFPLLLAGIAAYLLATAVRTAGHFHAMADGEGWSDEDRKDPLLSSAWTLTPRGSRGTLMTAATYGAVLGVLGISLYRSQNPPLTEDEGSVDASIAMIATQWSLTTMVAYGVIAAAIGAVAVILFRKREAGD
ncbi:MAG: hypothetical protein AAFX10_02365 [Pseudomonadota bacterium]